MSRLCVIALLAALSSTAAILPDQWNGAAKKDSKAVQPPDPQLFYEYGFDSAEQATYGPTTLTAWRFKDPTGAMAAYQVLRPAGHPFHNGNYVLQFAGKVPKEPELVPLYAGFAKLDSSALPVISTYLPSDELIPNSERYITGPVALERFLPQIPPSVAAFSMSTEAQYGRYNTKNGEMALAIFNYPTPSMARDRQQAFSKVDGVLAKRAGPLVAVVPVVADPDAAERLLAKVTYQAQMTLNQATPDQEAKGFARAMLAMFKLSGLIIALAFLTGAAFAAIRIMKRGHASAIGEEMITLHIGDRK
jgi:hypothetical protein